MQKANFSEAVMHRCCLRGVIAASSRWHHTRLVEADFRSGLDQLTDLGKADFNNADLSYALLQRTNLHGANLLRCCLYGTSFCEADLREADLRGCDLRNSKLEGAKLPKGLKLKTNQSIDKPMARR
ncbi:MAG: pentapeptide repeat-containing protein [Prochlorococcus sp. ALOHA_A2.0_51]|nr:pentapeptide repeat-containing protein [Prochlorococcus sp. ALOHA_A2.0_51]